MESRSRDITRQTVVIAAASFMLIAAAVGAGAFGGTSVSELQDGALSAQGSYLAPAGPAFSIWSLIYVGLIAYTVWQALPAQRQDPRQRAVGGWIAASMVLNGLWLVTAQFWSLIATVIVIALLLATLARVVVILGRHPARGWPERLLVDGANGLHFGWVTIATVANIAAWLTQTAPESWADQAEVWAVVVLVVVMVIGVASAWLTGRIAPALATAWGLAWLAVGRLTGVPESTVTAVAAIIVAVVLVVAGALAVRRRRGRGAAVSA
ncbi:TspO/MBR family protein [Microbacterium sp. LWO12-1.2]|uniref:TspO/MBR family protein n=1 Tax=Microbacterium sp. LWO12-1.2 TaxID=3135261 RepID=UPI003424A4C2